MASTLVTLMLCVGEVASSPSFTEVLGTFYIDEFTTVVAVADDRKMMWLEGATFSLTKAGDSLFRFDDKRVIGGGKVNRITGAIDIAAGRLVYDSSDYYLSQLIAKRDVKLRCQQRQ
jgi:hypothetical protein